MPPNSRWRSPLTRTGRPAISGISRSATRSSSGSTLFLVASITNRRWRWCSRSGSWAARSSACVQSALGVVELPDVVVERGHLLADEQPRRLVPGHRGPALVVDRAVAEHLEVLRLVALGRGGVVERVAHARALDRRLLDAVHERRLRQPGRLEHGRRHVDHVRELRPHLAARRDPVGPAARSCRCGSRRSATRPASSTGTACPSRAPSRPRSGCSSPARRTRRAARS